MTGRVRRNMAASVRHRLMDLSRARSEDFQFVLTRYSLERLLYRLSISEYASHFILKGAMLFQLWTRQIHRATRDLDLLGSGSPIPSRLQSIFKAVCELEVEDDGLVFSSTTIEAQQIKQDTQYQGIRLRIPCRLDTAKLAVQIDIGFGDAVTPEPQSIRYPGMLDFPAPQIRAYPRETAVAEKFEAMIVLGIANSRMKDFFDVWTLSHCSTFDGDVLRAAIRATFERRQTPIPTTLPVALTTAFAMDPQKERQWQAFIRSGRLIESPPPLTQVIDQLQRFLMPPTLAISEAVPWPFSWDNQHWQGPAGPAHPSCVPNIQGF